MWNQWTKEQRAFVASSLINLSSEEGSAPNKREEVHRAWVCVNDNEFQITSYSGGHQRIQRTHGVEA